MNDLLDSIALSDLRLHRRAAPLVIEFSRELTFEDIRILQTVPLPRADSPLQRLRATHHALARAIAGGMKPAEAAATTGHSVCRVNALMASDRGFQELVQHYTNVAQEHFVDVQMRLALLGTSAAELLMERLEESPDAFTNKELMQLAEVTLDRSVAPAKGAGRGAGGAGQGAPVNVSVTFVAPSGAELPSAPSPPMIEVQKESEDGAE